MYFFITTISDRGFAALATIPVISAHCLKHAIDGTNMHAVMKIRMHVETRAKTIDESADRQLHQAAIECLRTGALRMKAGKDHARKNRAKQT